MSNIRDTNVNMFTVPATPIMSFILTLNLLGDNELHPVRTKKDTRFSIKYL